MRFVPFGLTPVDNEAQTSKLLGNVQERRTIPMTMDANISVSDRAANRIREIMAGEGGRHALRVSVQGGGCSGFRYDFEIVSQTNSDDLIVEKSGARVAIDPVSVPFMAGSKIDFVDDLIGASFKITNPNVTASCGCGTSFSV
jgi:iron-sulfur cluster insertion protein